MFASAMFVIMMFLAVISHAEEVLVPVSVSASESYDVHVPEDVLDGNSETWWSALGKGHWIEFDLGSEQAFNAIRIRWHAGHLRKANFRVEISSNGVDFTEVWDDVSSGITKYFEEYLIMDHTARYVRLLVDGNNKNDWNAISEMQIRNISYPNTIWGPTAITASSYQSPNIPKNVKDFRSDTRWSANGKGQWIEFRFFMTVPVSEVEILWYHTNPAMPNRTKFAIDVKTEDSPTTWQRVFNGENGASTGYEVYLFMQTYRITHMRVIGYGNTKNDWISINEMYAWGYNDLWGDEGF